MKERIEALVRRPAVAHILAALDRYNKRLGPQFAAAVTYFSVLSLVPILMFAFAMLGLTLTVLRPDLLDMVKDMVFSTLGETPGLDEGAGGGSLATKIVGIINNSLANWQGIAVVAFLTAAYSGSNWIGKLKKAFRAMWRDKFSEASETKNFFLELVENLFIFFGLLLSFLLAFTVTGAGGAFSDWVIGWLNLEHVPGIELLLRISSIALVLIASWLLFAFLFMVLPGEGAPVKVWLIGTIAGAVLVTALQQVAGLLIGIFSGNNAASVFGPVIIIMLLFNLLATIILMVAAWVGTEDTWPEWQRAKDRAKQTGAEEADELSGLDPETEPIAKPVDEADSPRSRAEQIRLERWAARKPLDELRAVNFDPENPPAQPEEIPSVPQDVAARSVKASLGIGWGVGAATGMGIGAAVAALLGKLTRR